MASRQKQIEKIDSKRFDDGEEEKLKSVTEVSTDDEEANEDLSLKIVEKHLSMRAAKLSQNDEHDVDFYDNMIDGVVDLSSLPLMESEVVVAAGHIGSNDDAIFGDVKSDKKRSRKKKKVEKTQLGDQSAVVAKEEQKVETVENGEEADKATEIVQVSGPNSVEVSDNVVLRKLLRGPRYFDPPDSRWQACFNCGEEGHMAVNCTSALKRKKPCFVCGSFDHGAKQCSKGQDCFICKKGGHRAKDCPEKFKSGSQNAKICLICGDSGHDMFSCRNGYSLDDLKEVQCYICKSFGHLCCVDFGDPGPTKVSCFKCGQLGHTGLACNRLRGETNADTVSPSACYKCGETGHFARECMSSGKFRKRNFKESTPTPRRHRENRDHLGIKSAPHDLGKAHKRKKPQYEEKPITTPRKSKQRGGWITDDPGDISYETGKWKGWRSPSTPYGKGHQISALTSDDRVSSSYSSKKKIYNHRYSASRFDNSCSDGIRRNYDW
ncbi:hypothetical protein ACOSQ2_016220 [Xanthoceras sorbifolium]